MLSGNSAVGIFDSHLLAEDAVREVQRSGLDVKKLAIVGKDQHTNEHVAGYYNTGDRKVCWGKYGAFWGGLWGLLFTAGLFSMGIPTNSILKYETAIKTGRFVLIYHGTSEEVEKTRQVLDRAKALETALHVAEPLAVA